MFSNLLYTAVLLQDEPTKVTADVGSGLVYLIAAYAVVWLFIFGYLYSLNRRQDRLRREIEALKQEEAERQNRQPDESASNTSQLLG